MDTDLNYITRYIMEDIDELIIDKILNQTYKETPYVKCNLQDINFKNKKILILCGSGITKDYNIDTFEEMKKGNYYDIFSLSNYENDTLNFYTHINVFKNKCLSLNKINMNNVFLVTTNIDGMFVGNNLFEIHGNIFEYKCLNCNLIHVSETIDILPLCNNCNTIIRPNIQLYNDGDYNFNTLQYETYIKFKEKLDIENTIVFEVGCGLAIPMLRHESEVLKQKGYTVYRINIKDFDNNTNSISISGKEFIEYICNLDI